MPHSRAVASSRPCVAVGGGRLGFGNRIAVRSRRAVWLDRECRHLCAELTSVAPVTGLSRRNELLNPECQRIPAPANEPGRNVPLCVWLADPRHWRPQNLGVPEHGEPVLLARFHGQARREPDPKRLRAVCEHDEVRSVRAGPTERAAWGSLGPVPAVPEPGCAVPAEAHLDRP